MDRVRSLRNIPTRLRATNFCTSWDYFAPSIVRQPNGPECTQIVRNTPKCQFRDRWVDWVRSLRKIPTRLHGTNFCTSSARFAPSFVGQPNGLHPNSMKCSKMSVLGPMGWIGCVRCEKFRHDFVAGTFALVRLVLHRVS